MSNFYGDETIHQPEEFNNIPWNKLDPERCSRDWSIGCGGSRLPEGAYCIYTFREGKDFHTDIWILPPPLSAAIAMIKKCEKESAVRDLKYSIQSVLDRD